MSTYITSDVEMFAIAKRAAQQSPDPSRKTGVAINTTDGLLITAYNDFPFLVKKQPKRLERPDKYLFMEHAERNAIYKAARMGLKLVGCQIWLPWFPCVECARAIVQIGALKLTCVAPDLTEARYDFKEAETILTEGGIYIKYVDENGEMLLDGEVSSADIAEKGDTK
jgi:dCMP deaminase